ncbi:hypothetical protein [Neptuniibacter sp.]|uniref:hypothetical protein n=1 Tax=Neptuniibacter sp. TaxID=1962643 RepID=UPI003B5AB042
MGSRIKNNKTDQLINVALEGFSGPNLAMLEYCLIGAGSFELVEPSYADVVVINGDQPLSLQELESSLTHKYSDKARVLISIRDLDWDGFYVLKKPHSSEELLALITTAFEEFEHAEGAQKPVNEVSEDRLLINLDNLDFYQSRELVRKRQADGLKKKLMRGNLALSAADRLVQSIENNLADLGSSGSEDKIQDVTHPVVDKDHTAPEILLDDTEKTDVSKTAFRFEKPEKISKELAEALINESCGNLPDLDLGKPEEIRRAFVNTEGMLIEKMQDAVKLSRKSDKVVEITGLPGLMLVTPDPQRFIFSFSTDFMNQLALTKFGFGELSLKELDEFHADAGERLYDQEIDSLIWEVAIWTARGRLFSGIDPHSAYQLKEKPDFDYFLPIPNGKEIAELWSGRELSASDVVGILGIPQRFVFAFMSGVFSLGWFQ